MPATYPLALYRGDTYRRQFQVWLDAAKTEAADLTDVVAEAEIRDQPAGATIIPIDCTVTLPNTIDILLTADNCRLVPARAVWDLQLTYPGGDVLTIVAGAVTNTPDVTDSTVVVVAVATAVSHPPRLQLASGF